MRALRDDSPRCLDAVDPRHMQVHDDDIGLQFDGRGAVLVTTRPWVGCDLTLSVTRHDWAGLGTGRGRLRWHEMTIRATGRGAAIRPREVTVPVPLAGRDQLPAGERPASGR